MATQDYILAHYEASTYIMSMDMSARLMSCDSDEAPPSSFTSSNNNKRHIESEEGAPDSGT